MSVVQPLPGTQAGSEEQPLVAKLKARAATSVVRFMFPPPIIVPTVYFKRNRAEMARQSRGREMAQCNQTAATQARALRHRPRALLEQGGLETRLTARVVAAHPLRPMRHLLILLLPLLAHAQPKAPALPDGAGKEQVEQLCSGCHGLARVMGSGYLQAYWHTVVRMMINFGVPIPPDQVLPITDYLAKNLPEKAKPDANILPGPAKVAIREWQVPIPGSRPHDPLATRDGAIWYTGQMTNRLGRVDPKTGQVKEYPLKSPATGLHGLVEDRDGNIFHRQPPGAHRQARPADGRGDRVPHAGPEREGPPLARLRARRDALLHATAVEHGRPARPEERGDQARHRPYAALTTLRHHGERQGVPHTVLFGTNKIARIDPKTLEMKEHALPDAGSRPRRMAYGADDSIYYTDYPRGMLGRLDPQSGKVTEWPSPGGPKSEPYGIVFAKGAIWYSESGTRPNTIVRFDPKTERFQTWAIPSGGYIVRKMDVTPTATGDRDQHRKRRRAGRGEIGQLSQQHPQSTPGVTASASLYQAGGMSSSVTCSSGLNTLKW